MDVYLNWTTTDYGGVESIMVPQKKLWLPDITVGNSVTAGDQIGSDDLKLRISYEGVITWSPTVLLSTGCTIGVTYYPFDTQKCSIEIETETSLLTEIYLYIDTQNPLNLERFSTDGSWILESTSSENVATTDSRSKIRFNLLLKRRTTFYVVNIVLPVMFMSLTSTLVFALPADAGEKMGTSITVLLAYAVYLSIVTDYLPNTSLETSILALYLNVLLGVCAASVLVSVYILRQHHKADDVPVGPRTLALAKWLQGVFRCCRRGGGGRVAAAEYHQHDVHKRGIPGECGRSSSRSSPPEYEENEGSSSLSWQEISQIFDWACFLSFSSIVIFTTVIFMTILLVGGAVNKPTL